MTPDQLQKIAGYLSQVEASLDDGSDRATDLAPLLTPDVLMSALGLIEGLATGERTISAFEIAMLQTLRSFDQNTDQRRQSLKAVKRDVQSIEAILQPEPVLDGPQFSGGGA